MEPMKIWPKTLTSAGCRVWHTLGANFLIVDQASEQTNSAGAVAIVSDLHDPFCSAPQVITPSVYELKIALAKRFYDFPAKKLKMIGITGTNGKTTTSYLVRHLLKDCSLIGTIEAIVNNTTFPLSFDNA